jgi:hypothetical protein
MKKKYGGKSINEHSFENLTMHQHPLSPTLKVIAAKESRN